MKPTGIRTLLHLVAGACVFWSVSAQAADCPATPFDAGKAWDEARAELALPLLRQLLGVSA